MGKLKSSLVNESFVLNQTFSQFLVIVQFKSGISYSYTCGIPYFMLNSIYVINIDNTHCQ
jgi:hypothetical protein